MRTRTFVLALLIALPLFAQTREGGGKANPTANTFACSSGMVNADLQPVPEIVSSNGILRGTLYTVSEQVMIASGTDTSRCFAQWVRAYRRDAPSNWNPPSSQITAPLPGPTLRARVGDVVELTFLNVIDAAKFPGVDDGKCDTTSTYPGGVPNPDQYPDCFAGSVYTNMHYHGTHVSPSSTADNVFLQIAPSPRRHDGTNAPVITADSVQKPFADFFAACEQQLQLDSGPKEWPRVWSDLPSALRGTLGDWVHQYGPAGWEETNERLIDTGNWPQFFVGAYPYCFRIPRYTSSTWPPAAQAALRTPHTHGAGVAEVDEAKAPARPLIMGQAPGTHWYHAHKHGSTTINVMNGMTGAMIIEGQYDDDINRFYGANWTRTQPVLVINQLGAAPPLMTNAGGGPGPLFSVNGRLQPKIKMKGGEVQMWRIVNSSGRAGIYFLEPTDLQWKQLAQDGVQFNAANYAKASNHEFQLASGNRADLLVKAPKFNRGKGANNTYEVRVYNTVDPSDRPPQRPSATVFTLATVVVTGDGPEMQFIPDDKAPAFPPFLADIKDKEITGTKVLTFASTALDPAGFPPKGRSSEHLIDGKKFDGELGAVVELNRAEEWKIVNETYPPANLNQISHPFHIHLNPFQVTEVFDPNEPLTPVAGPGTVSIAAKSDVVKGEGTHFRDTFKVGDYIFITAKTTPPPQPGIVTAIASDTELKINFNYGGSASGAAYTAAIPKYTIDAASKRAGQCVIDPEDAKPCAATEPAADRIWWDVFPIPSGHVFERGGKTYQVPGYFKMRSRFVDFSGYFVLHCHILAHEDRGMMTVVQIAPLQTPYSHH